MCNGWNLVSRPGLGVGIALLLLAGCSGPADDGLKKFPARGLVHIDGQPVQGLIVRLIASGDSKQGSNARFPVGVTDAGGEFRVSTNGEADGAVPGEYDVTVVWPASNEPPLRDLLGGAYATPAKSKFHVTVQAGENVFAPLELSMADKGKVRAPRDEDD